MKVACVVGARPNFMKIAPVIEAMRPFPALEPLLVHTGQHYDEAMKASFFEQLAIPEPDVDLGVGSGSHAVQTAEIMKRFEPVVDELDQFVIQRSGFDATSRRIGSRISQSAMSAKTPKKTPRALDMDGT